MIFFKSRYKNIHLKSNIFSNIKVICFALIAIFICVLVMISNNPISTDYNGVSSIADCFVLFIKPLYNGFFIVPWTVIIVYKIIRNDFNEKKILRYEDKSQIMKEHIFLALTISLIITIYYFLLILIISALFQNNFINWESYNSLFFRNTGVRIKDISIWKIIFAYIIIEFIINYILSILTIILFWLFNNVIYTLVIMFCIACFEVNYNGSKIFYGILNIEYYSWIDIKLYMVKLVYGIIVSSILLLICKHVVNRKEFIGDKGL